MHKQKKLYHGSSHIIEVSLRPVLENTLADHIHTRASVFGTERIDLAALFMFPTSVLASIGFEQDISYICIWGTHEDLKEKDTKGFIYVLPGDSFEKIGKEYEWQSFVEALPLEVKEFPSWVAGMMDCGVQVYFIQDEKVMDNIVADKNNRALILKDLISENKKKNLNVKKFM